MSAVLPAINMFIGKDSSIFFLYIFHVGIAQIFNSRFDYRHFEL